MALCLSNCCLIHRNCLSYILSCICMQPVRCLQPCTQPLIIYFYPALSSQPATFYLMLLFFEFLNFDIDTFERHLENKLPKLNLIRFVKCHSQGVESRHCIVGWKPYLVALREYWCANWGTLVDTIHTGHHKTRWLYGSSYVLCGQVFTKIFLHVKFISNVPQRTHAHLPGGDWDRMILGYKPRNVTSLSFEVCCMRGEDAHFCRVSAGLCCVLYSWTSSCFLPPCVTASPPSVLRTPDTYRNCFNPISRNELSMKISQSWRRPLLVLVS